MLRRSVLHTEHNRLPLHRRYLLQERRQQSVLCPQSTGSFGAASGASTSAASGNSGAADPAFDFSTDHSQFDQRAQFNTPTPEQNIPQPSQSSGSSEQVNEAQSRENERIADEILKNRSKEE